MHRFDDLVAKLAQAGTAAFLKAHPHPFLVFVPPNTDVQTYATQRLLQVLGLRASGSQSGSRGVGPVAFAVAGPADSALTIGRDTTCNIVIPLPRISKAHARLRHDPLRETWVVEDAGSKNGCTVDGHRVEPGRREELPDGATLTLGPYTFRFFEPKSFIELAASCVPPNSSDASDLDRTAAVSPDALDTREFVEKAATPRTESGGFMGFAVSLPAGHELIRRLGAGGMAEVLLTRKTGPSGFSKQMALKRMLPEFATDRRLVQMFIQEARVAARVNHPNVVQIFELLDSDGQWFIAMEYIDGIDLSALIRMARGANVSIPLPLVLRIAGDICAGLQAAHTATGDSGEPLGIVHRDISPHNILIAKSGISKVADFGVSKAADQLRKTRTGELKGKLVYMAPEQVDSTLGGTDARTDIFAVGLTLYEMLTFQRPLKRDSEVVSLTAVIRADIKDLREVRPDLPVDLCAVVMRCLQRLPSERFTTAAELQRSLEKVASDHSWVASPTTYSDFVSQLQAAPSEEKGAPRRPPDDDTDTKARTTPVSASLKKDAGKES